MGEAVKPWVLLSIAIPALICGGHCYLIALPWLTIDAPNWLKPLARQQAARAEGLTPPCCLFR